MKRSLLLPLFLACSVALTGTPPANAAKESAIKKAGPSSTSNTILNGSGKPSNSAGRNGDFYIDTENLVFYGPKKSNKWPAGTSMRIVVNQTTTGTGSSGAQGEKGDRGPAGPAGPAGAKGETGAVGPAGPAGAKGDAGVAGVAGAKGDVGPAGPKGDTGLQGLKGDTGAAGATGAQGPKGDTGATGSTGAQGPKGDTGAAGADGIAHAYSGVLTGSMSGTSTTIDNIGSLAAGKKYVVHVILRGRTANTVLDDTAHIGLNATLTGGSIVDSEWTGSMTRTYVGITKYKEFQWSYWATINQASAGTLSLTIRTTAAAFGTDFPLEITGKYFIEEAQSLN